MATAHVSGELGASVDQAWAVLSDLQRNGEWLTIHGMWKSEIPTLVVGVKVTEQLIVMGMPNDVQWTVAAFEPPTKFSITGAAMANTQITFTLSLVGEGSTSTVSIDVEFAGTLVDGPMGAMVATNATGELKKSLAKLQELLS